MGVSDEDESDGGARERGGGGRGVPCCCPCAARADEGVRDACASAEEAKPAVSEGSPADMREASVVGRLGNIADKSCGEICRFPG